MASVVFTEPQDTIVLRKYLTEMENLYRKSPHVSRIYLYSTKKEYATLKGDFDILLAYLDSCAEYYQNSHNMTNLKRMYNNKASALHQSHRYDEAYLMLRKYVSLSDSLYKNDTQKQLNELSTRYNLNKLELEARGLSLKARNIQFFLCLYPDCCVSSSIDHRHQILSSQAKKQPLTEKTSSGTATSQ